VPKVGIAPFDQFVASVMKRNPYRNAKRVFWIVDNAFIHRGQAAIERFRAQWPNAVLLHTPNHASWLNQVEIYFSIVQRKVLMPNDFLSLHDVPQRFAEFERYYEEVARTFQWKFTRKDLAELLGGLAKWGSRLARVA
jgi:hypothetical protein